jgi:putative PEP-CTERM system TPR-repeat lipoprotein
VKLALAAAQDAVATLPNEPIVLDALARTQFAAGESQQALSTYSKLAAVQPKALAPLLGAAKVQFAGRDSTAAMQSVRKALGIAPDDDAANRMAVSLMLSDGHPDQALALARALASRRPELSLGDELVGMVERQRGHWKEAIAAYQAALRKRPSSALAQRLHETLLAGGSTPQAGAFTQSWLKDHPRDVGFLVHLAISASAAKDFATAEARNREALAIAPNNAVALNNLAWAMHQQKKPGALAHAERANDLVPELPAFMDTLAVLLADGGQTAKAIELQQRAVAKEPDTAAFRLTLAKLYLQAGNRERGREELERLRALGNRFADQATVEQLLAGR